MLSYEYKLYRTKKTKYLDKMLGEACFVWNHALALQKRYYRLYGKYINSVKMQKHFAKRIKRNLLHSQTTQEIIERLDAAYNRFFKHIAKRPPKFKKTKDFTSFVFKQGGYKLTDNVFTINKTKKSYKFSKSRDYEGNVKNIRIKRNQIGEFFIYIITDAKPNTYAKTHDGASVGIDFGLKHYLITSDGEVIDNPQYLKRNLKKLRKLSRSHSTKQKNSNNREKARLTLCRMYDKITNHRNDFQWKLAHILCRQYDNIFIEDLKLGGMTKLWGRKMNDLAHGSFVEKLSYVASKYGVRVHKINRWFPSSKLCECGYKNSELSLKDRKWTCPHCGQVHNRDFHASEMILRRGIYELESGSKTAKEDISSFSNRVCIQESHIL